MIRLSWYIKSCNCLRAVHLPLPNSWHLIKVSTHRSGSTSTENRISAWPGGYRKVETAQTQRTCISIDPHGEPQRPKYIPLFLQLATNWSAESHHVASHSGFLQISSTFEYCTRRIGLSALYPPNSSEKNRSVKGIAPTPLTRFSSTCRDKVKFGLHGSGTVIYRNRSNSHLYHA